MHQEILSILIFSIPANIHVYSVSYYGMSSGNRARVQFPKALANLSTDLIPSRSSWETMDCDTLASTVRLGSGKIRSMRLGSLDTTLTWP
jgi:hypothetical protein